MDTRYLIITPVKQDCGLVPLVRDRVGQNGLNLKNVRLYFFQVLAEFFVSFQNALEQIKRCSFEELS